MQYHSNRRREATRWVLAVLVATGLCRSALAQSATNIIFLIGDGMGYPQVEAGVCFKGSNLVFETWPYQGQVTTYSADSAITDSAAAGTAMATGEKVNNGVISLAMPGDSSELETMLEYLKSKGKRTGLVTTTHLTHATPAAFGAHTTSRTLHTEIAQDYVDQTRPNVLLGGGGFGMTPSNAAAAGYAVVTTRAEMQALSTSNETMVCGQFGNGHLPYESQGLGALPHLSEMTQTALEVLSHGPNGFFLMIEGGRIDHACHANDITSAVLETVEFDNTVQTVLNWVSNRTDTLVLVTADHETGGLTVLSDNGKTNYPTVSWSSLNHTASNVAIYARGPGAEEVSGLIDNTNIYDIVVKSYLVKSEPIVAWINSESNVVTQWVGRSNDVFRLETTDDLVSGTWTPVCTTTCSTETVEVIDTNSPSRPVGFYRLISVK